MSLLSWNLRSRAEYEATLKQKCHEAASDCKRECEHDHIDETNRKSRSLTEGCSEFQEKKVGNEKGIQQPPSLCDIKKKKRIMYTMLVIKKEKAELVLEQALSKNHRTALRKEQVGDLWTGGPVSTVLVVRCIRLIQGSTTTQRLQRARHLRLAGTVNICTQLLTRQKSRNRHR